MWLILIATFTSASNLKSTSITIRFARRDSFLRFNFTLESTLDCTLACRFFFPPGILFATFTFRLIAFRSSALPFFNFTARFPLTSSFFRRFFPAFVSIRSSAVTDILISSDSFAFSSRFFRWHFSEYQSIFSFLHIFLSLL